VAYAYEALEGYGNVSVTLDGVAVAAEGTVAMEGNHRLEVVAEPLAVIDGSWEISWTNRGSAALTLGEGGDRKVALKARELAKAESVVYQFVSGENGGGDLFRDGSRVGTFQVQGNEVVFEVFTGVTLTYYNPYKKVYLYRWFRGSLQQAQMGGTGVSYWKGDDQPETMSPDFDWSGRKISGAASMRRAGYRHR